MLAREHIDAVTARRALMLDSDGDLKALDKADGRVSAVEASLVGVEDALNAIRNRIAQLNAAVASAKDTEAREAQAIAIEAIIPKLEDSVSSIGPELKRLAADLHACAVPEAVGTATHIETMWQQALLEVKDRIVPELRGRARLLRNTPTAPPVKPSAPPTPGLFPQPARLGDVVEGRFVDWSAVR